MSKFWRTWVCVLALGLSAWGRIVNVVHEGVPNNGIGDARPGLTSVMFGLADGDTLLFPPGIYTAAAGTSLITTKRIFVSGAGATLRNIRFQFLSDVDFDGLRMVESDCSHDQVAPWVCPPAGAMISLGYIGYAIHHASFRNFSMAYTRAYTGIEMGFAVLENVLIENFAINDAALSGISIYGGSKIDIRNGVIRGNPRGMVDDGVAIASSYGPVADVTITGLDVQDAYDALGLGTLFYYPVTRIRATGIRCWRTVDCIFVKPGEELPLPATVSGYSYLDGLTVDDVVDSDPLGDRYQHTLLIVVRAGAVARNLHFSRILASTRSQMPWGMRMKLYVEGRSRVENLTVENASFTDLFAGAPNGPQAPGYPPLEGVYVQTDARSTVSGMTLRNVCMDGVALWAVDASNANLSGLNAEGLDLVNFPATPNRAYPFLVPVPFPQKGGHVLSDFPIICGTP